MRTARARFARTPELREHEATLAATDPRRAGWRSHTFADGVRSLTLVAPLDVALAGRLWTRITELSERGARRVIVDVSAVAPRTDDASLLAAVFAGQPPSCQAVVVAPADAALADLLPASIGVARTLSDAHRQLSSGVVRHEARARPAPGTQLPADERQALTVRQSLRWAERAAREGDRERARSWLTMVAPPAAAPPGRSAPPSPAG